MKNIIKTPSFIRLAALTVLHAVFAGFINHIFVGIFVALFLFGFSSASVGLAGTVCIVIPAIMGLLFVDRPKWWLISLPFQFLVGFGMVNVWKFLNPDFWIFGEPSSIGEKMLLSLSLLAIQSVGVGIKVLWYRHKRR